MKNGHVWHWFRPMLTMDEKSLTDIRRRIFTQVTSRRLIKQGKGCDRHYWNGHFPFVFHENPLGRICLVGNVIVHKGGEKDTLFMSFEWNRRRTSAVFFLCFNKVRMKVSPLSNGEKERESQRKGKSVHVEYTSMTCDPLSEFISRRARGGRDQLRPSRKPLIDVLLMSSVIRLVNTGKELTLMRTCYRKSLLPLFFPSKKIDNQRTAVIPVCHRPNSSVLDCFLFSLHLSLLQ